MTRLEFAIMLKEEIFELICIDELNEELYWICEGNICDWCELKVECDGVFNGRLPKLRKNELEEFLNLYPELRVIL